MNTITPNADTLALLRQVSALVEFRDPDGNTLGFYAPASMEQARLHVQAAARIDRTELARRKASHKTGRTTREVFERLQSLTQDPDVVAHLQEKIEGLGE